MTLVTTAILPVLFLLAGGAALRRWVLGDETFWRGLEWMSYRLFMPALFITSIADADLSAVTPLPLAVSLMAPIVLAAGALVLMRRAMRASGPELTAIVQGAIRINTYVGLIFALALAGQAAVATFAIASALVVPLVNMISVGVLAAFGSASTRRGWRIILREIVANPLIQGCVIGLAINVLRLPVPAVIGATLSMLAAPALVCGTLIAGAALRFTSHRRDLLHIAVSSVVKLALLPLAAYAIAVMLGASGTTLLCIVLICAIPTSTSGVVLAARMGGDVRLIAAITGIQTVLAMATLPAVLSLLPI